MTTKNETPKNDLNATSHKTDVISRFLYEMAAKHNVLIDDIIIGIEEIHPRRDDGKIKLQVMDLDFNLLEEFLSENGL